MAAGTSGTQKVQVYLEAEQVDRLHQLRRKTRRSLSGMVASVIDDYFARKNRRPHKSDPASN